MEKWTQDFINASMTQRLVLISGKIWDHVIGQNQQFLSLNKAVHELLQGQGFGEILTWDPIDGAQPPALMDKLLSVEMSSNVEPYDMGTPTAAPSIPKAKPNPEDFAKAYARCVQRSQYANQPFALILDWSRYLFTEGSRIEKSDLNFLASLSKTLREYPEANSQNSNRVLLVLICPNNRDIPSSLWCDNPHAKNIVIPAPNKQSRRRALELLEMYFHLDQPIREQIEEISLATEGASLVQLEQLARLSRSSQNRGKLNFQALLRLHRHGQEESPWEKINAAKIRQAKDELSRFVKGQERAINRASTLLLRAWTGLAGAAHSSHTDQPKGVLFLAGPTGVGKTELAKAIARFLFGDEQAMLRFDMSEYQQEHSAERLVGAPPGFIGYDAGGQLTNAVRERPFSVLLFDEIEKAHPRILDKFLQILEDGRLTDGQGQTTQFGETLIVFTSNIGAATVLEQQRQKGEKLCPEETQALFIRCVAEHFRKSHDQGGLDRPELLNRIGMHNIVPFDFLQSHHVDQIIGIKLKPIADRIRRKWNLQNISFAPGAEQKFMDLIRQKVNLDFGGRDVVNVLNSVLVDPLAEYLALEVEDPRKGLGHQLSLAVVQQNLYFEMVPCS